jgi:hypothetical protein
MELRHRREIANVHVYVENGHVEDSMTVAPQFEKGFGPGHLISATLACV